MRSPFYHIGMVVPDIDEAMRHLGDTLGLRWAKVQRTAMGVTVAGERVSRDISFVYSTDGPPYIELISVSEPPWAAKDGIHHLGYWTDDLVADLGALLADGYTLAARGRGFAYLSSPTGALVELVDTRSIPMFDRWMAGGDYLDPDGSVSAEGSAVVDHQ